MKQLIRKWLGITNSPPAPLGELAQKQIREEVDAALERLLKGEGDYLPRDGRTLRIPLSYLLQAAVVRALSETPDFGGEKFIDAVVERIRKKQVGGPV